MGGQEDRGVSPAERWAIAIGVAVESAKVFALAFGALVGWVVGIAPRAGQETLMDAAVIAAVLMLVGAFGSLAIIMYGLYRIWRG